VSQNGSKKQKQKSKQSLWAVLVSLAVLAVLATAVMFAARVAFILFFMLCFCLAFLKSNSRRFYKAEQRLATSQIRSVAMGLAELRGKVVLDIPLISPVTNTRCAGYTLTEETSSKDDEGRVTWSEVSRATFCNDFRLVDASGEILVIAEGISLFDGKSSDRAEGLSGNRQQGEIVLCADDEIVLIGDITERNGQAVMACGSQKNALFAAERGADVDMRRDMAPLIRAGGFYAAFAGIAAAAILWMTPLQMAQLQLPNVGNYAQMASLGPAYAAMDWIYRNDGALPFMAAFGLMGVLMILLLATRVLLPSGIRNTVQSVLWGWMAAGVIVGGPVTLLLVLADMDPMRVTLIWLMILVLSLLFSVFQQRALRAAAKSILKHSPKTDGDSVEGSTT
jgi:hypothetical protein